MKKDDVPALLVGLLFIFPSIGYMFGGSDGEGKAFVLAVSFAIVASAVLGVRGWLENRRAYKAWLAEQGTNEL